MMVGAPTRSGNTLRFPWASPDPSTQSVSVEYPRSLSGAKYIFVRKSVFFGYELKLLISTAGGRFPRAWLEPPRSLRSLWGLKAHGTALSFVPPKTFCYSRRSRRLPFQSTVQCFGL